MVHSRLKESGLDLFCLELHSNKSHKREVLDQFERVLSEERMQNPHDWGLYAESIADLRSDLNNYVNAIHKTRETGESFYQGMERLTGLRDIEHLPLEWPPVHEMNRETLEDIKTFIHDFWIISGQIIHPGNNPWKPVHCSEWSANWKGSVDKTLQELEKHLGKMLFRSHKSFIINTDRIEKIVSFPNSSYYEVKFNNCEDKALLSRDRISELMKYSDYNV